jgi:1-aminocyclopropane-1-carboxylate synthase
MAVAENKLCAELLLEKIQYAVQFDSFESDILNYTDPTGHPKFKQTLAAFLTEFIFLNCNIKPEQLVITTGCCGGLIQLSLLLFDSNDSILIPTPYYPAFDQDFFCFANVQTIEINGKITSESALPFGLINRESLNQAYEYSIAKGHTPKGMLLTNPSNPMGILYSKQEIEVTIKWCIEKKIHLIVDEIYALSVFSVTENINLNSNNTKNTTSNNTNNNASTTTTATPNNHINQQQQQKFQSVATMMNNHLGEYIHILWSLSKDFGASGLRVGVIYSHNEALLHALSKTSDAMQVSNIAQATAQYILSDFNFVYYYIKENRNRLYKSYNIVKTAFNELGIKTIDAAAGIFIFCDFRILLTENSFVAERELFKNLCKKGIVFTPGECCHCKIPGF